MTSKSSLLPDSHDKFSDKQYWDDFFVKRKNEAFEWYGTYSDLKQHFVDGNLLKSASILVIGCGNSDLSVEIYDAGFTNILNIDFSELVIEEMKTKYSVNRPLMRWEVMDMTQMGAIATESVDFIVDKGALDALMSTDCMTTQLNAIKMYNEITRILTPGGSYLCISLAEDYIFTSLTSFFSDNARMALNYTVNIHILLKNAVESAGNLGEQAKAELFLPFCFIIRKDKCNAIANTQSLPDVDKPNLLLHYDVFCQPVSPPTVLDNTVIASQRVLELQEYHRKCYKYKDITVGRYEKIDFYADDETLAGYEALRRSKAKSSSSSGVGVSNGDNSIGDDVVDIEILKQIPRFTITILDYSTIAQRNCAVFIVPLNRESEYQFSTEEGLTDIAISAACKRLIVVRNNKPHVFPENPAGPAIQEELNSLIITLLPAATVPAQVPYMALEHDVTWSCIHTGRSALSGGYIVEEKVNYKDISDCPPPVTGAGAGAGAGAAELPIMSKQRRLIFLSNQQFVQTEVSLLPLYGTGADNGGVAAGATASKKSKKKNATSGPITGWKMDNSVVDDHHCGVVVAVALASWRHTKTLAATDVSSANHSVESASASASASALSKSQKKKGKGATAMFSAERLRGSILSSLHARLADTTTSTDASSSSDVTAAASPSVLIVGLGGGSLSSVLSSYCNGSAVYACDWDPAVIDVAREYFMYNDVRNSGAIVAGQQTAGMFSLCMNGVDLISQLCDSKTDMEAGAEAVAVNNLSLQDQNKSQTTVATDGWVLSRLSKDVNQRGLHMLVIDVDAKPNSNSTAQGDIYGQGVTAPPADFITAAAFAQYKTLLTPPSSGSKASSFHCGTLVMNVVCRSDAVLDQLLMRVMAAYRPVDTTTTATASSTSSSTTSTSTSTSTSIYLMKPSCENVNMLLIVVFSTGPVGITTTTTTATASSPTPLSEPPMRVPLVDTDKSSLVSLLNLWLQSNNTPHDPLALKEFVQGNDNDSSIYELV